MFIDIPWLNPDDTEFPPIDSALDDPNGLLAMGGDLSPERLLAAYRQGIFPWFLSNQPILWWSPDPRFVLRPEDFKISRSLKKSIKNKSFSITVDVDFEQVITACSQPRRHEQTTWLIPTMINAYQKLHQMDYAHSIEVWLNEQLVGGLYGIAMGQVFCGESMFAREADASKVALAALVQLSKMLGITLIDCQVFTEHLQRLGAVEIPRSQFINLLTQGLHHSAQWPLGTINLS